MAKLTTAGLALIAQLQAAQNTLTIDKMIYANIAGLDPEVEPSAAETKPDAGNIVHESDIGAAGYVDPNTVVFSDLLDATIGDFSFNWIGLFSSANNTLIAVTYVPLQSKRATDGQNTGNTLCKNFAINYTDIKDLTGITIQADTWQLDISSVVQDIIDDNTSAKVGKYGMILSHNETYPLIEIDISPGRIPDSTNSCYIELDSTLTKRLNLNWYTDPAGGGGKPTNVAWTANTWYHVFVIYNETNELTDAGIDTDINAANLLATAAGYTKYQRLGSVLTDASGNVIPGKWHRIGDGCVRFAWDVIAADHIGIAMHTDRILRTISVPSGKKINAIVNFETNQGGVGTRYLLLTDPDQPDTLPDENHNTIRIYSENDDVSEIQLEVTTSTNTASQIGVRGAGGSTSYSLRTVGYFDYI